MRVSAFTIRDVVPDYDPAWFATRLRESDHVELLATSDDILATLTLGVEISPICKVAEVDGQGAILFGCAPHADSPHVGVPWLLATDAVTAHPGALTKLGQLYVRIFRENWPVLMNAVDERNVVSVRWLERLGFTINPPIPFGRNGEPFHIFTMGL